MILVAMFLFAQVTVPCGKPRIRKDFRVVQKEGKWTRILAAYRKMQKTGRIEYYAKLHYDIFPLIHGTYTFLTWHRAFLWEFENEIRAIGGDDLTLPYVDWAAEATTYSGAVERSISNNPYYYAKQKGRCLSGRIYTNYNLTASFSNATYSGPCISRRTLGFLLVSGWADLDATIITSENFTMFSDALQYGIHAEVHVRIGGDMAMPTSPVDPYFFAHHGFVDSTLNIWQFLHSNYDKLNLGSEDDSFVINGNKYSHDSVFKMSNMCVKYLRYTKSATSHRQQKRQLKEAGNDVPDDLGQNATVPDSPISPVSDVVSYNNQLSGYYSDLKKTAGSDDDSYKKIASFYPGSFIPIGSNIPDAALKRIGLDPAKYAKILEMQKIKRNQLSKFGDFVRKAPGQ
eukprot:NODE_212_length_14557_cov_0.357103.p3 type:complete len:400 gc:universal NODE_212_length_14557_cov_0.357103:12532-11333(-)